MDRSTGRKLRGDRMLQAFPFRQLADAACKRFADALAQDPRMNGYGVYVAPAGNRCGWAIYVGPLDMPRQVTTHNSQKSRPHKRR